MNAFTIKNLECAYKDGHTVLRVPLLEVPFGKIFVFLGPSGVGKSTLLETLGLMNHTIKTGQVIFSRGNVDFLNLWTNDQKSIPDLRSEHMSFIFQENNLLDNLSAIENAMIPLLIQGETEENARSIIREWCINLDLAFINEKTRVSELSVGQKQRLAFIRAASPRFTVLFGDEPTGNLDEKNGDILMEALRKKIKSDESQMLSIIVSHDIDLALKFADEIIILTKDQMRSGIIKTEHILRKEATGVSDWVQNNGYFTTSSARKYIANLL